LKEIEIKIELEALITEREGMIAENRICKTTNDYYPYDENAFLMLVTKMRDLTRLVKDCK